MSEAALLPSGAPTLRAAPTPRAADGSDAWLGIVAYCLTFTLVFGLSASVDVRSFGAKFKRLTGILLGMACQFVLLPLLGLCTVLLFDLEPVTGITLLVVTSSPGGSYSNWWCSLFNADLALSVAMTTASSVRCLAIHTLGAFGSYSSV